jgi:hypothetical protein
MKISQNHHIPWWSNFFEYRNLLRQLNEYIYIYIFDDVIHKKQLYLNTPICLFLTGVVGTSKTFTLKLKNYYNYIIETYPLT